MYFRSKKQQTPKACKMSVSKKKTNFRNCFLGRSSPAYAVGNPFKQSIHPIHIYLMLTKFKPKVRTKPVSSQEAKNIYDISHKSVQTSLSQVKDICIFQWLNSKKKQKWCIFICANVKNGSRLQPSLQITIPLDRSLLQSASLLNAFDYLSKIS